MKAVTIRFPDTTDLSALAKGKGVAITVDSTTIPGGTVTVIADIEEQSLPAHTHSISATGVITGATGEPVIG